MIARRVYQVEKGFIRLGFLNDFWLPRIVLPMIDSGVSGYAVALRSRICMEWIKRMNSSLLFAMELHCMPQLVAYGRLHIRKQTDKQKLAYESS